MRILKTRQVCDELRVPYHAVFNLIRARRIKPPSKDASGDYLWLELDIEQLRRALDRRHEHSEVEHAI